MAPPFLFHHDNTGPSPDAPFAPSCFFPGRIRWCLGAVPFEAWARFPVRCFPFNGIIWKVTPFSPLAFSIGGPMFINSMESSGISFIGRAGVFFQLLHRRVPWPVGGGVRSGLDYALQSGWAGSGPRWPRFRFFPPAAFRGAGPCPLLAPPEVQALSSSSSTGESPGR